MDRRSWLLFATVTLLWGIPYFLIKVSLADLTPGAIVWARVVIGALTLLPVAVVQRSLPALRDRLSWLLLLALIEVVFPFLLIAGGEQYVTSSLTGILIATEPMAVALFALRFDPTERVSGRRLAGMLVGLAGVAVLLGLSVPDAQGFAGAGMILLATLMYGAGALLIKVQFADVPPAATVGGSLSIAGLLLIPTGVLGAPHMLPSPEIAFAVLVLGVASTGLGFLAFFALIARAGAARAAVITYVSPTVALILGVALRHEPVTAGTVVGMAAILAGSRLATGR